MWAYFQVGKTLRSELASRDKEGIVVVISENESPVRGLGGPCGLHLFFGSFFCEMNLALESLDLPPYKQELRFQEPGDNKCLEGGNYFDPSPSLLPQHGAEFLHRVP